MKKTFNDRSKDEKQEGYDTVQTGLPSGRFQDSKQVLTPDQLGVTESSIPGTDKAVTTSNVTSTAKKVKSKMSIAPDVSVETLGNKQVGGVPLAATQTVGSVAGLSSQSSADDTSKIPYSGGRYRPQTRYGKKRSEDLFEMDNTISEQVVPVVDDALDLRESPEAKQGYNGRKQFKQTRSKKNFEFVNGSGHEVPKSPQQLLQETSADFIRESKMVYTNGQIIRTGLDAQADYPTVRADGTACEITTMRKSNYHPYALNITVTDDHITGVEIAEDRYDVAASPLERDQANMNAQIDANNVAKAMVKMQTELGRETTDKWSPLGYVIHQPYEYNMLMHDIESTTGSIAATAYRSAVSSMAFQRNILAKDGVNPQANAVKMLVEGYAGALTNSTGAVLTNNNFNSVVFNQAAYQSGSAAALIAMFDSTGKYSTKADLLGMQRSLSLHLSQADNNINPFHCKPNFIKLLDKAHTFSTVDGNYNPMLPIFATNKIELMLPLSLNFFLAGWKNPNITTAGYWTDSDYANPYRDMTTGTLANYAYQYSDLRNTYFTRIQHPIVEGIIRWLLKHEGAFVKTFGAGTTVIPFEFNMENPSLLSFLICSASQDIAWERNIIFRDILFAGEQNTYVWDDLQGLDKLNPLYSTQLTIGKYDEPLKLGKLAADTALRTMWHADFQLSDYANGEAQYFAPWYFNEQSFGSTAGGTYTSNEGWFDEATAYNMSIPSIRDGVRHQYVDLIKGMDERDVRLSMDRYVGIPSFTTSAVDTTDVSGSDTTLWTRYYDDTSNTDKGKYIKLSTIRYDGNSDGRLVIKYDLTTGANRDLYSHSIYCIPKELGVIDDVYLYQYAVSQVAANAVVTRTLLTGSIALGNGNTAHAMTGSSDFDLTSYRVRSTSYTDAAIDRSAALSQSFWRAFASIAANTFNVNFVNSTGIIPAFSYNDGNSTDLYAVYNLQSNNESSHAVDTQIRSNARTIWTLLQRFFLPVNPFANCFTINTTNHAYDPLEACSYFGFCGCLASDFTQDILERLDIHDQLGLDYTEDVFMKASLIFR